MAATRRDGSGKSSQTSSEIPLPEHILGPSALNSTIMIVQQCRLAGIRLLQSLDRKDIQGRNTSFQFCSLAVRLEIYVAFCVNTFGYQALQRTTHNRTPQLETLCYAVAIFEQFFSFLLGAILAVLVCCCPEFSFTSY